MFRGNWSRGKRTKRARLGIWMNASLSSGRSLAPIIFTYRPATSRPSVPESIGEPTSRDSFSLSPPAPPAGDARVWDLTYFCSVSLTRARVREFKAVLEQRAERGEPLIQKG